MKILTLILVSLALGTSYLAAADQAASATTPSAKFAKSKKAKTKNVRVIKSKLSTDHEFEDKLVNGQYQYPDEATATVDDEKILDDLVGVRKEFKDRLKQSAERR